MCASSAWRRNGHALTDDARGDVANYSLLLAVAGPPVALLASRRDPPCGPLLFRRCRPAHLRSGWFAVTVLAPSLSDVGCTRALPSPRRLAVFRALQVGDMLCAVPALRALRAAYPDSEITLIGLPWARAFAARFDRYLDGFLEFPGFPGLPEQPVRTRHIPFFLRDAQRRAFDLVLQMHGSGRLTNPILALLGATHYAGFRDGNGYCPDDPSHFLPWPSGGHEIHRLLQLTAYLGFPSRGEHLEFPIRDADREELHELPATRALVRGEYVCIHPGARHPAKRWAPEH